MLKTFCLWALLLIIPFPQVWAAETRAKQPPLLLQQSMEPALSETASETLAHWCRNAQDRPALVLVSQNPFLQPLPPTMRDRILLEIRKAPKAPELSTAPPAPLLLPEMILSAALEAGLFSELVWILPTDVRERPLSAEAFQRQLTASGIATEAEAKTFVLKEHALTGSLRGIPVRAYALGHIPSLEMRPSLVHLDLSFLPPLFRNEISTPLFPLVFQSLGKLRALGIPTLSVSIGLSGIDGGIPLSLRFAGRRMATLVRHPEMLDAPPPLPWQRYNDALYLEQFFEKEKTLALYLEAEKEEPSDAAVKYAIYQNLRRLQRGSDALAALAGAVALDPVYAMEYLELSQTARTRGLGQEALEMMDLALKSLSGNPLLRLQKADLLAEAGRTGDALKLLKDLRRLAWSPLYYPKIPKAIDGRIRALQSPSADKKPADHRMEIKPAKDAEPKR